MDTLLVSFIGKILKELKIQLTSQTSNYDVIDDARCKRDYTVQKYYRQYMLKFSLSAYLPQIFNKMLIM